MIVYLSIDLNPETSETYIGIPCYRAQLGKQLRGVSGAAMGSSGGHDIRFAGVAISNSSGDNVSETVDVIRFLDYEAMEMTPRYIRRIDGVR